MDLPSSGFNPVLGFLPAATADALAVALETVVFQSRAGFSPCRDGLVGVFDDDVTMFQSRAGFSPCRDPSPSPSAGRVVTSFNPVLGFLPAATV